MKLVIAIVHERDKHKVSDALLEAGHKFTIIASTGGFLRDGNVTFLVGTEGENVDQRDRDRTAVVPITRAIRHAADAGCNRARGSRDQPGQGDRGRRDHIRGGCGEIRACLAGMGSTDNRAGDLPSACC